MLLKYCRLACRSLDDTLFWIRLYRAVKVEQLEFLGRVAWGREYVYVRLVLKIESSRKCIGYSLVLRPPPLRVIRERDLPPKSHQAIHGQSLNCFKYYITGVC